MVPGPKQGHKNRHLRTALQKGLSARLLYFPFFIRFLNLILKEQNPRHSPQFTVISSSRKERPFVTEMASVTQRAQARGSSLRLTQVFSHDNHEKLRCGTGGNQKPGSGGTRARSPPEHPAHPQACARRSARARGGCKKHSRLPTRLAGPRTCGPPGSGSARPARGAEPGPLSAAAPTRPGEPARRPARAPHSLRRGWER